MIEQHFRGRNIQPGKKERRRSLFPSWSTQREPTVSRHKPGSIFQAYVCPRPLPNSVTNPWPGGSRECNGHEARADCEAWTKQRDVPRYPSRNTLKTCQFVRSGSLDSRMLPWWMIEMLRAEQFHLAPLFPALGNGEPFFWRTFFIV